MCVCVFGRVWLFTTPWTVVRWAPLSMEFPKQKYWSGLRFSSPGHLSDPGIEPVSPAWQGDSLPTESPGKPTGIFVANWSWCPLEWNRWTAWSVSNSQKSEPSYHNGESWPFVQLLALRHFTNVEFLNWMVGFFRNDPTTLLHEYIISLPSSRLQRDLHPFA